MKRSLFAAALLLGALSLGAIHLARGAGSTDRPLNVPEKYWIALADNLAFVVIPTDPRSLPNLQAYRQMQGTAPPASGFFMAKTPEGWRHLVVIDPPR